MPPRWHLRWHAGRLPRRGRKPRARNIAILNPHDDVIAMLLALGHSGAVDAAAAGYADGVEGLNSGRTIAESTAGSTTGSMVTLAQRGVVGRRACKEIGHGCSVRAGNRTGEMVLPPCRVRKSCLRVKLKSNTPTGYMRDCPLGFRFTAKCKSKK